VDYHAQARSVVVSALEAVNEGLPPEGRIETAPGTLLLGDGGTLDSISFANLVMRIQEAVLDQFGVGVAVADESMLAGGAGPFRSVETLTAHVAGLIADAKRA
jgi:hypothetical protein